MSLSISEFKELNEKARLLRLLTLDTAYKAKGGHLGGSFSIMELGVLLYHKFLNIKPNDPNWVDRDRVIMSKGHVGIGLAAILADKGYFPVEWLNTYNQTKSLLGMHLDSRKVPGVDFSTGSLGHGLSQGVGIALAARKNGRNFKTFVILGDGECHEGSIWEAAMAASHFCLKNMITIIDRNKLCIDGQTEDIMKLEPFVEKWKSFGFDTKEVDGHDLFALDETIESALNNSPTPVAIICNTVKGCGLGKMAGNASSHYFSFSEEDYMAYRNSINEYHDLRGKI